MMMLTFYFVGLLVAASVWWLIRLSQRQQIKPLLLAGLGLGIALILFCIAWGMGSVLEGVPRAAAMGVVFFGFPGVILLTLTGRKALAAGKPE
jgi:hypothetical protein